jgi:hypothetical protein
VVPDLLGSDRVPNTDVAMPGARVRDQLKATQDLTSSRCPRVSLSRSR